MRLAFVLLLAPVLPVLAAENVTPAAERALRPVPGADSHFEAIDARDQVRKMGRGVNIVGYDPMWEDFRKARFQERHFRLIREGGFQTVRVNLHAFRHMDAQNRLDPAWLKTLDWVVQHALTNGLVVILDEHDFLTVGRDIQGSTPKLLAFWKQIAQRYREAPAGVVFEILNEPNGQLTGPLWNALLKETLAVIRESNPARNVVIGAANWNSILALESLELPAEDRHIIVTVHYYLPMQFTHQGARWNRQTAGLSGISWGSDVEKRRVKEDFARVQEWAKAAGRPILLGEFGAYDKAEMPARVRYTTCVARTAESLGWAWTYWQFDSDFIAFDMAKDEWVQPIWKSLVP